jgi:hypothetical protein
VIVGILIHLIVHGVLEVHVVTLILELVVTIHIVILHDFVVVKLLLHVLQRQHAGSKEDAEAVLQQQNHEE